MTVEADAERAAELIARGGLGGATYVEVVQALGGWHARARDALDALVAAERAEWTNAGRVYALPRCTLWAAGDRRPWELYQ